MDYKEIFYPESKFGGFTDIDGTIAFYTRVNALVEPSFVVLDVGCGRGGYAEDPITIRKSLRILKGKARTVIGIDIDKDAAQNSFIDKFYILDSDNWPLNDNSVDLIMAQYAFRGVPEKSPNQYLTQSMSSVGELPSAPWNP